MLTPVKPSRISTSTTAQQEQQRLASTPRKNSYREEDQRDNIAIDRAIFMSLKSRSTNNQTMVDIFLNAQKSGYQANLNALIAAVETSGAQVIVNEQVMDILRREGVTVLRDKNTVRISETVLFDPEQQYQEIEHALHELPEPARQIIRAYTIPYEISPKNELHIREILSSNDSGAKSLLIDLAIEQGKLSYLNAVSTRVMSNYGLVKLTDEDLTKLAALRLDEHRSGPSCTGIHSQAILEVLTESDDYVNASITIFVNAFVYRYELMLNFLLTDEALLRGRKIVIGQDVVRSLEKGGISLDQTYDGRVALRRASPYNIVFLKWIRQACLCR